MIHNKCLLMLLMTIGLSLSTAATAIDLSNHAAVTNVYHRLAKGHGIVQLGGYWSHQGKAQQVNIDGLIGDYFTTANTQGSNGLASVGYFVDGQDKDLYHMSYGLNWFYLAKTDVSGTVIQENLFSNLSYSYNVTHYPLYVVTKSTFKTKNPNYGVTLDVGIGPNFMRTAGFHESPLDAISIPDNIFSSATTTTFSATAGLGIKVHNIFGSAPIECGYRFFYLGQGKLNSLSDQVLNTLNTGGSYGNAVMCAMVI